MNLSDRDIIARWPNTRCNIVRESLRLIEEAKDDPAYEPMRLAIANGTEIFHRHSEAGWWKGLKVDPPFVGEFKTESGEPYTADHIDFISDVTNSVRHCTIVAEPAKPEAEA